MKKYLISILVLFLLLSTSFMGVSNQQMGVNIGQPSVSPVGCPMNSSWPMYCHDTRHTGRSPYSTENNRGGLKWKFRTEQGGILSSPAISSDGTIYVGGGLDALYAVFSNGTEKWEYKTGFTIISSPAIAKNGTIYFGSLDNWFYALNPDGTLQWKYPSGCIYSSPAIASDGTIFVGSSTSGCLLALNPNGSLKWQFTCGDTSGSPAINNDIVYIDSSGWIYALYISNGTKIWNVSVGGYLGSPAIGDDGTLYSSCYTNYLYAFYPNGTVKWRSAIGLGNAHVPSIASDGTIYIASDALYAINPDGMRKWSFSPGSSLYASSDSQAVSADGTIYYGWTEFNGADGHIEAVNPDGTEQWRENLDSDLLWSSPSIGSDGTVYVGATLDGGMYGFLYAFLGKKFEDPVLTKPVYGMIYVANHKICMSNKLDPKTVAIGKLTFVVTHPDPVNVSRIEFWVDGTKMTEVTSPPYVWTWTKRYGFPKGAHQITIVAVNKTGMEKAIGIAVWKIF